MIKTGNLVRLNKSFYNITINCNPNKDRIGIVIRTEPQFYNSAVTELRQDRHYVFWGGDNVHELFTYEPTNALIKVD